MQHLSDLEIAIVGGSIAGCAAAVELSRLGAQVSLFERSGDALKDRGAGIGIPSAVVETLKARDLVDQDIPYFPAMSFSRIWRSEQNPHFGYLAWDQPADLAALNWGGLYRNLRQRVDDAVYHANTEITKIEQGDKRVTLTCADGRTASFDLVVCADGYASLGRRSLFPEIDIRYAGYVLWRGFMAESELDESPPLEDGIRCVGYPQGHGIFYFVPGANDSVDPGQRLVNWGVYVPVAEDELAQFMTDKQGRIHQASLPPGAMPLELERRLKQYSGTQLPAYYADITARSQDTFAYAIFDCEVPAYCDKRVCLVGDAGAFARPHSAAGALKGMNDAIALSKYLSADTLDTALSHWNTERTQANNELVRFGNQLGEALVKNIPDWSRMDVAQMESWFNEIVTIKSDYIAGKS